MPAEPGGQDPNDWLEADRYLDMDLPREPEKEDLRRRAKPHGPIVFARPATAGAADPNDRW